jgi:RNA-splicing ligase RtcB
VPLKDLYCYPALRHETVLRSLGTLGGGNHFIELDRGTEGELYLVIHSGSRRLGKDVAIYHQNAAFFTAHGLTPDEAFKKKIKVSDVQSSLVPQKCFLSGEHKERYLHDMNIAVKYALVSRKYMGQTLIDKLGLTVDEEFTTVHNYIDTECGILRKGAVSAQAGEKLIIPINMRDGSLLCLGKGNPEWNFTAPHGAGRLLSRKAAQDTLTVAEFQRQMAGVYTTCVSEGTLDESPMAYKGLEAILSQIGPTAEVIRQIRPIYNYKAGA